MTYIIKAITPEERIQVLEETRAAREQAGGIALNEHWTFLLNKKKDSENYGDRIINASNGNYFIGLGDDGREDMAYKRYLFYYQGKTFLFAIITGADWSEGRLRYFGDTPPQDSAGLKDLLAELGQVFRVNGIDGKGWDDDNPRTQFIPKVLVKKEGAWI